MRVRSQGNAVDLLLCFNQEAFDLHHHELARDGHIVCDAESVTRHPGVRVPLLGGAARGASHRTPAASRRGKNMVAVGLVCGLLGDRHGAASRR